MIQDLLQQRRTVLLGGIRSSEGALVHSDAWLTRVLGNAVAQTVFTHDRQVALSDFGGNSYEGVPRVAAQGYALGALDAFPDDLVRAFLDGIARLQQRSDAGQTRLASDDVALLGIADGLACLEMRNGMHLADTQSWLLRMIDDAPAYHQWSDRMRSLAGDVLDQRGRLRVLPNQLSTDVLALDLVLRAIWPRAYHGIPLPNYKAHALLQTLVTELPPDDPERGAVWLRCIDLVVSDACVSLTHTVSDTARILGNVQHAFKRWPYEGDAHRKGIAPIRWLIDDEYDVQSLLWMILYPIYREALVDETFLPHWGNVQPRADLGITTLKLIIEVKIARQPRDFHDIEGQVGDDVGLYFRDPSLFNRMIVFIYDDCDKHHPERYDSLKNALKHRDRIEEVIIIRRPGMLPDRMQRGAGV
jgi:REase_DpnII-MboI